MKKWKLNKKNILKKVSVLLPLAVVFLAFSLFISAPLLIVWKESYISKASLQYKHLDGSTDKLKKEKTRLVMEIESLSSRERIENIAKDNMKMSYPSSERIVIISDRDKKGKRGAGFFGNMKLFAVLFNSINGSGG